MSLASQVCSHANDMSRFSTLGRLMAGGIADKYGRINTQSGLICLGVFAIFAIWLPFGNTLAGLYVFSCVFGLASGSFLSLAPACIGQISKASEVGGRFGICYSMVSLAYVSFLSFQSIQFSDMMLTYAEHSSASPSAVRCSKK